MASAWRAPSWLLRPVHLHEGQHDVGDEQHQHEHDDQPPDPAAPASGAERARRSRLDRDVHQERGAQLGGRGPQPAEGALAPERLERLEQRRADRPTGGRDPDGRLRLAQLRLALVVHEARRRRRPPRPRRGSPRAVHSATAVELARSAAASISGAALPFTIAFVHDVVVALGLVVEEERDHRLDLAEQAHALLHQRRRAARARPPPSSPRVRNGRRAAEELVDGQRPDVLGVDVLQLLHVEERRRGRDVLQAELLDDLLERADLDAVARTPPEQGEVVDHRLGEVALGGEVGHRHGVLALRQLLATLVDEHRQVGERLRPAQARARRGAAGTWGCRARGPRPARRG